MRTIEIVLKVFSRDAKGGGVPSRMLGVNV